MKKFTDSVGREWKIEINIASIRRVRDLLGVDLMQSLDGKFLQELSKDIIKMVDIIYVLIKPQADSLKPKLLDTGFGAGLDGDAVDAAVNAFLDELVNFSPKQKRTLLQTVLKKVRNLETTTIKTAQKLVDSVDFDEILSQSMQHGDSSTNTPVSPE